MWHSSGLVGDLNDRGDTWTKNTKPNRLNKYYPCMFFPTTDRICCNFIFLYVQFSFLSCGDAVFMLWLGLGRKKLLYYTFSCFAATHSAGNILTSNKKKCPEVPLKKYHIYKCRKEF